MLALRELRRRPVRTAVTAAGVAAGIASYLLLVGSAEGLLRQYRTATSLFGADVVVQQAGVTSVWSSAVSPEDVASLRAMRGVAGISRVGLGKTKLIGAPLFLVFGVDPSEGLVSRIPVRSGRLPRPDTAEIALGAHAAARLRASTGGELDVRGRTFRVTGVYATGLAALDAGGIVDLPAAQRLFNLQQAVNILFLDVTTGTDPVTVARRAAAARPGLDAVLAGGWASTFGHVELIEGFARFLAGLAVLLAALGIAVVLQASAVERTAEIAILRAIGWSRSRVARLVLVEALLVSFLGLALGALVSEAAIVVARSGQPGYAAAFLPPHLPWRLLAEALVVAAFAGLAGSASALSWAIRVAPARALRAS